MVSLVAIQSEFQRAVMSPDGGNAPDFLLPSRQLSRNGRLAVYQNAYVLRLLECLRDVFAVFRATVGDEAFDQLAREYLARFPSSSYTLGRLSERFVEHLRATRPLRKGEDPDWFDFAIDVAEFEQAINTAFDGPGCERLSARPLHGKPEVAFCPSLRLLALGHPVDKHWSGVKGGGPPAPCPPSSTYYAIYRREYVVRHARFSSTEFQILTRLRFGMSFDEALSSDDDCSAVTEDAIYSFCRRWAAEGFVRPMPFVSFDLRNHIASEAKT